MGVGYGCSVGVRVRGVEVRDGLVYGCRVGARVWV